MTPDARRVTDAAAPLLEARGVGKRFGDEVALAGVDFDVRAGEIHGLVGGNGAGKSTLMRILAGAIPDHEGTLHLDGQAVRFHSPRAAAAQGVAMVHQELSGIGSLSVVENLFLGRQPTTRWGTVGWARMRREARERLEELNLSIDARRRLDRFPLVVQQMVEIARGLHSGARILILDEPTSALSPPESRRLFALLRDLARKGVGVVFISHFLEDVLEISDRVTILRDGRRVLTEAASRLDKHTIIHAMLGHGLEGIEPGFEGATTLPPRAIGPAALETSQLSLAGVFEAIDLSVAPGECLGLYGFVGAGHQELTHALAGATAPSSGVIRVGGKALPRGVRAAKRAGVVLVAADRTQTLARQAPVYQNVTLAHLRSAVGPWLTRGREIAVATPKLAQVGCRPIAPRRKAGQLSGGNQQKVVLAKWLLGDIRVLVLEEPTRGMDVGAKDEVMAIVASQKANGAAVILASTEPELLLAHADRIIVFRRGRPVAEFSDQTIDKRELIRRA